MAESWDDATFFNRMGVMMPRNGPVGVPNNGGLAARASNSVRPAVVQQPPMNGFNGAPSGPAFANHQGATLEEIQGPAPPPPMATASGSQPARGANRAPQAPAAPDVVGAPAEMTFKFHEPAPPPAPVIPEPPENPLGTEVAGPGGSPQLLLGPEGKNAWAGERLRAEEMFGAHPFLGDPHAPKPSLIPGKPAFNPFMGSWS